MVVPEYRIVTAAIAIFATLGGIVAALTGLVFDEKMPFDYGVGVVIIGTITFTLLLNVKPNDG